MFGAVVFGCDSDTLEAGFDPKNERVGSCAFVAAISVSIVEIKERNPSLKMILCTSKNSSAPPRTSRNSGTPKFEWGPCTLSACHAGATMAFASCVHAFCDIIGQDRATTVLARYRTCGRVGRRAQIHSKERLPRFPTVSLF